ncbi:MAG TPA: SdrD B-like domain-containing protein, partial [Candidatus Angelobacter sp.]
NPRMQVRALDYIVSLTDNGPQHYLSPFSVSDSVELRGAALTLKRGDNQYTFFGGTTIPFFYLTLGSTRDIGGFSLVHKQSKELSFFATTSYINTPTNFLGFSGQRQNDYMQTGGLIYQPDSKWTFQGTGGASNHGGLGRAEVDYITPTLTFFGAGSVSSPLFPLNQVFSLFSSTTSIKSGLTLKSSERFTESVYYQHAMNQAINNLLHAGSSDYLTPSLAWKLNHNQDLNLSYTFSRNTGGFANQTSTGNRVDGIWRYLFTPRFSNTAEVIVGSLQDPLQLNSEDELVLRDGLVFPVKGGTMQVQFQHDRRNPSLAEKLNSELNLLSPALQNLFLSDPVAFVNSGNVPPEVKALLDAEVPINTSIAVNGQFRLGNKLSLAPNFTVARSNSGKTQSWTPYVGYSLMYQVTRTLTLNSGLSNVWVFNNSLAPQRTTIFFFGFNKTFSALPISSAAAFLPGLHGGHMIMGRVFRDNNFNGLYNEGESGLPGIRVELDHGEVAVTDELGRYRFTGVGGGEHHVTLNLTQFPGPVRMTTHNEVELDMIREKTAIVDFGVVDFARLMGNIFNDLRFEGKKQPDSRGLGNVHLILDDGRHITRTIIADPSGGFETHDILPGDYKLSIDASTLPANYVLPKNSFVVRIPPVTTVVQDIPARALRSISGRVFLKVLADSNAQATDSGKLKIGGVPQSGVHTQRGGQGSHIGAQGPGGQGQGGGGDYNLVPLAGVQLSAGFGIAISDENGNFLLRDLPAGDLSVAVVPVKPVPPDMKVPSGIVHMPPEPIEVQGATIVISNADLVPYLVGKTADQVRDVALHGPIPASTQPAKAPQPAPVGRNAEESRAADVKESAQPPDSVPPIPAIPAPVGASGNDQSAGSSGPSTQASKLSAASTPSGEAAIPHATLIVRSLQSTDSGAAVEAGNQPNSGDSPALSAVSKRPPKSPLTFTNADFIHSDGATGILLRPLSGETDKQPPQEKDKEQPQETDKEPPK